MAIAMPASPSARTQAVNASQWKKADWPPGSPLNSSPSRNWKNCTTVQKCCISSMTKNTISNFGKNTPNKMAIGWTSIAVWRLFKGFAWISLIDWRICSGRKVYSLMSFKSITIGWKNLVIREVKRRFTRIFCLGNLQRFKNMVHVLNFRIKSCPNCFSLLRQA